MKLNVIVEKARESGRTVLTEAESKIILSDYGVPVVPETIVTTAAEAIAAASGLGYPVVLKGIGEHLLHKTESHLVHLNLTDKRAVSRAANQILQTSPGTQLLVQPQIHGKREFVAGLVRDPDFGPAMLFGLGGIFTEALSDVVFRLAPLTRHDAADMIDAIRSRSLLGPFRGEQVVDRQTLIETLMGLSAMAADFPEFSEIDINPLIATAAGQIMELLDLSAAFSSLPLPHGNRIAIMTLGGGWGVVTADLCDQFGLQVPPLSGALIARIDRMLPPYWSRSNPIDLVGENDVSLPLTVMDALLQWDGCDAVINLGILGRRIFLNRLAESVRCADPSCEQASLDEAVDRFSKFEGRYIEAIVGLMEKYDKPVFRVSLLTDKQNATVYRVNNHHLKSVFYQTPEQAVKAAARMVEYSRYRSRHAD